MTLAEVTLSRYVARRKVEVGLDRTEVMVPQAYPPGAEAEVDFGEFYATIACFATLAWHSLVQQGFDRPRSSFHPASVSMLAGRGDAFG